MNHNDDRDRGAGGQLARRALADMLRDFIFFDTVASEHPRGNMIVELSGLKADTTYLITWYSYENGPHETFPVFVYQDEVTEATLLLARTDPFGSDTPPEAAANTFLAAGNCT
jgi:hypothetical protein